MNPMHKRVLDDVEGFSAGHRAMRMKPKPPDPMPDPGAAPEIVSDPGGPSGDAAAVADGHGEPDADQAGAPSDMDADNADPTADAGGMVPMQLSPAEAKVIMDMRAAEMGSKPGDDLGGIDVAGLAAQLG